MKTLSILCLFCLLLSCAENDSSRIHFMSGTWKMEGKEQYEVWETTKNNELVGYSYKLIDNQKTITETLSIKKIGDQIIFEATVPDQNEGRTIQFTLNNEISDYLSFENMEHDFPKKIQYKRINDNKIEVTVTDDEGRGFSYTQVKQITDR